jgi:antirestriction protein ArdC
MDQDRKDRMRSLIKRVAGLSKEEREVLSARMMIVNTGGHAVSVYNSCLLALQAGERAVTVIGGFKQWLKQGRCVRKGEHGMGIWFPVNPAKSEDGEEAEGSDTRFMIGTVFDISQTDELPARA